MTIRMVCLRRGRSQARQAPALTAIVIYSSTIDRIIVVAGLDIDEYFLAPRQMKNNPGQIRVAALAAPLFSLYEIHWLPWRCHMKPVRGSCADYLCEDIVVLLCDHCSPLG